jgi:LytT family two-component system sensor histidine kinase NatK
MSNSITYFLIIYPITTLVLVYFILKCGHQRDINKKLERYNLNLRKQRHDFLNFLETISYLVNCNEIEEANNFLKSTGNIITVKAKIDNIKNPYVASVLNSCLLKAEKVQITIKLKNQTDFSNFPLSFTHTVTVLSNVINNAIENCKKEDGFVYIESEERDGFLYFTVTNNGSPIKLYKRGDTLEKWQKRICRWHKLTSSDRGCGLLVVKEILEQYNGSELIIEDNNPPTFTLKLKIGG